MDTFTEINTINHSLCQREISEAFEARLLKLKEALEKCRDNIDEIVGDIREKNLCSAVNYFIASKIYCRWPYLLDIAQRLGEAMIITGKAAYILWRTNIVIWISTSKKNCSTYVMERRPQLGMAQIFRLVSRQ